MISRILIALGMAMMVVGCASDRPLETGCVRLKEFQSPKPDALAAFHSDDYAPQSFEAAVEPAFSSRGGPIPFTPLWSDALILSGGGQWGAYGAGVINGWSPRGRLPARLVTGISTGALQATFAYLGRDYDDELVGAYSIRSESQLVKRHGSLFFLNHGSTADIAPLKTYIKERVGPLLGAVKAEYDVTGRQLLVGAVDGLSGRFYIFDLSQMASTLSGAERLDCYTAALIASASVPVIFRQTTINGRPWLDGGLRHSMFLPAMIRTVSRARAFAEMRPGGVIETDRSVYALKNGVTEPTSVDALPAKLLPTIGRLRSIVFHQLEVDSLELAGFHARNNGLKLYSTSADGWRQSPECQGQESGVEDEIFDPGFMRCMIAFGQSRWKAGATPWKLEPGPSPASAPR